MHNFLRYPTNTVYHFVALTGRVDSNFQSHTELSNLQNLHSPMENGRHMLRLDSPSR